MSPAMKIAVAGATGRVGRHVVDLLEAEGHDVVAISRSHGVDVISGDGLADALAGVDAVVDAATQSSPEEEPATTFFTTAARNLHEVGERAGVTRMVVVSIIGCDRFTGGYGAAKLVHEQRAVAGPIPTQVVRAAQFHEFVEELMEWGRQGDVCYVPEARTQLVAARTVAQALADLVTDDEFTPTPPTLASILEIAGPREESLVAAATLVAERRGDPVRVQGVHDPADPLHEVFANGALLPGLDAILAGPSFEAWLESALVTR